MIPALQGRDVAADSLRAIIDSVLASPAYNVRAPRDPWSPVRRAWLALLHWIDQLRATNPVGYKVLVWSLVLLLAAIVLHAMWIAARTIRAGTARSPDERRERPPPPRDAAWYAREANRLVSVGRVAEAMQVDFLRLVLELDARRVTRFDPSKTPGEYLRDSAMAPEARREFRDLIMTLYAHAFARAAVVEGTWDRWRAAAVAERYAPAH